MKPSEEKAEAASTIDEKEQSPAEIVVVPKTEEKAEAPGGLKSEGS